MAQWQARQLNANSINSGNEYEAQDFVAVQDVNSIVEGVLYAQQSGGGSTEVTASDINSENATNGQVLTADGQGGASWQTPSGGGGGAVTGVKGNSETTYRTGNVNLTKSNIGLGNVDNTSDANKPISTATQTALDGKVPTTRTVNGHALTGNVTVSKSDVGLSAVTNDAQVRRSEMGVASGVATLGADGKVPSSQLPAGGNVSLYSHYVSLREWGSSTNLTLYILSTSSTPYDTVSSLSAILENGIVVSGWVGDSGGYYVATFAQFSAGFLDVTTNEGSIGIDIGYVYLEDTVIEVA